MKSKLSKLTVLLVAFVVFAAMQTDVSAPKRISDSAGQISLESPDGWVSMPTEEARNFLGSLPNPNLRAVGFDEDLSGISLFKVEGAQDLIPHIQVSKHEIGGLGSSEEDLRNIETEVESIYSAKVGASFRLFLIERSQAGGHRSIRLTGIYRWRTVNIKILQHLIPGNNHLYVVTYTAKEKIFPQFLGDVESTLATIRIADAPLDLDWFWSFMRWLGLLGFIGFVLWGILFTSSIRPQDRVPSISRTVYKSKKDLSPNPFLRKK